MTEYAGTQGQNLVTAPHPENGLLTACVKVRKPISADSFRKLTAFLKKDSIQSSVMPAVAPPPTPQVAIIETISENLAPPVASETFEPEIAAAAFAPILIAETIEPETVVEDIELIFAAEPIVPEIVAETIAPVSFAAEPIVPEIVADTIAPVSFAVESIVPELKVEESLFSVLPSESLVADLPAIAQQILPSAFDFAPEPTIIEVEPPKPQATVLRPRPRDAFALSPSALPNAKPVAAVVPTQTPAQEQEAAELARSLLDMMASGASSGLPQERALAADTLLRMLPRLPLKSLIMLADRLCIMDAPPHLLVAKLICDPRIEVAGPLLEECSHITDEDLSLVIQEGEPAKRRMMARRRHVSRAITAQLVNTGDPSVLLNLVRNQNAEIPHEGFEQLVRNAAEQQELLAPLCIRADLPVPFAFELFWSAPAQLRRYLLSRFLTDSETLTKILKIALVTNGDENSKVEFPDPEKIMDALQMADDGKLNEAAEQLGECAKIHPKTAARILADRQGDPLAALFKATGVPRATMHEILQGLMKSASGMIDPNRDPEELQSLFDSLSFNKARILLTYWDWSTLKTGPYAPLN